MLRHVVMFKLKEEVDGRSKAEWAVEFKERLEGLKQSIPEIIDIEVGVNTLQSEFAYDLVLVSTFESEEALARYQVHPAHVAVGEALARVRIGRVVGDYLV